MIEITVIVYIVVIFISTVTFLLFFRSSVFFVVSFIDVFLPCFFHFSRFFCDHKLAA